ncbi:MAG: GNAT family N-acetyltransferase [Actinobacteria bacterium]|nr:GNAT family N-acetyltransferase [Actinomycetota bacterium]
MSVRPAVEADVARILILIRELAEYERALDQVRATEEDLLNTLFGHNPQVFAHVVEVDNVVIGIAIWHLNYSTWLGKHGMYLEDLYVDPKYRGEGHGMELLKSLAQICVSRGYERFQWWVLDWNTSALELYKSLGAVGMDEWTVYRLSGDALQEFGRNG